MFNCYLKLGSKQELLCWLSKLRGCRYRLVCTPGTGVWSPPHITYLGRKITTTIMSSIFISMCQLRGCSSGRKLNVTFHCWCDTNTHILHKLLDQWLLLAALWCAVLLKKDRSPSTFLCISDIVLERFLEVNWIWQTFWDIFCSAQTGWNSANFSVASGLKMWWW